MSNQAASGFKTTQITVQNYDQLQAANEQPLLDPQVPQVAIGGRYDFDDGGLYVGGWLEGKANGYGICTGPNSQGEYSGSWSFGYEVSGVYKWPGGTTYQGEWQNGRRHGLGTEYRKNWVYKGEWTSGNKGRYGVKISSISQAGYFGTWANSLQDGYGTETYSDGDYYQGQFAKGHRHGFGIRQSSEFAAAYGSMQLKPSSLGHTIDRGSTQSLNTDGRRDIGLVRGGFVLVGRSPGSDPKTGKFRRRNSVIEKGNSAPKTGLFRGLLKKQKSTGDIDMTNVNTLGTVSRASAHHPTTGIHSVSSSTDSISLSGHMRFGSNALLNKTLSKQFSQDFDAQSSASFVVDNEPIDPTATETYMGEWKDDKRTGFGICERSDGLLYAGEWWKNQKHGYGVTTFPDGSTEEGKYKNNVLIVSSKKRIAFVLRPSKIRERIDSAVAAAKTAQQTAMKKADIAISRTATARDKAEQAVLAATQAQADSKMAVLAAKQFGALIIDPETRTISQSDQLSTLTDTENVINRIKNQNLINLSDGQLIVPEVPLRRRLSQHNDARKSFRSQSIKDVQNLEFNNLHKINEEKNKPDAFPGRQGSLRNKQQQVDQNPAFSTPSTFGYQTESPQSFNSNQSRNPHLVKQASLGQTNFPPQSSSMYQSQPHLVRPNSSASSSINHPYTSQRPPLNVQTSFDLGKSSMVDHMEHYQSLSNRYASTSKINQKPASNRAAFLSSGNLQSATSPSSSSNLQNRNSQFNSNLMSNQHNFRAAPNLSNINQQQQQQQQPHYQQTPDSGVGSLEESNINYQQRRQHQQGYNQSPNLMLNQQQQAHQQNPMHPSNLFNLQNQQQALLQTQQMQHQQQQQQHQMLQQNLLTQGNFNFNQSPQPGTPQMQMQQPNQMQSQFNQMNPMNPMGSQPNVNQQFGSQYNLQSPLGFNPMSDMSQQIGLHSNVNTQFNQMNQLNPMGQMNPMNNPMNNQMNNQMNNPTNNPMNNQTNPLIQQPNQQLQQSMWNAQLQQQPYQNQFQPQPSPPFINTPQQSTSLQLNDPNSIQQQQQQNLLARQAVQQQITQQNEQMNRPTTQSIQNKEKQLEQHYGKQESLTNNNEPKRSSWRTASLFRPGLQMGDSKNKNESLLKRKPSLQTNFNKDPSKPIMSREQVSVMSSAEREHRRKEAELAQKLAKNPFLYFYTSNFRDWLVEQQLILIVLAVNLVVVLICYQLFYSD